MSRSDARFRDDEEHMSRTKSGVSVASMKWASATCLLLLTALAPAGAADPYPTTVHVFFDADIHFYPAAPDSLDTETVEAEDRGRVIRRTLDLPEFDTPRRILATVTVRPIPVEATEVGDKWDRAGHVRLALDDGTDIEVVKFITAYGGRTEHTVDVSYLAPLLRGRTTFKAFISTWMSPGWKMDFSLRYEPPTESIALFLEERGPSSWVTPLVFVESFSDETPGDAGVEVTVTVPEGLEHVSLHYLVSGHCTDGRGADEFVSKDNVILVDGVEVERYRPWRDDCRHFRDVNPYCRRWSDGTWSADFSRSGWCPGDAVEPHEVDLTEVLEPGEHTVRFHIDDIRPKDEDGAFGYWRVSSYLVGW